MLDLVLSYKLEELLNVATDAENKSSSSSSSSNSAASTPGVSSQLLSEIKTLVRKSDSLVVRAFEYLMEKMASDHSTTRLLALEIINVLMLRSKLFRDQLAGTSQLNELLQLAVGLKSKTKLPPPTKSAEQLRRRAGEMLREWTSRYGCFYKTLGHAERYLSNFLAHSNNQSTTRGRERGGERGGADHSVPGSFREREQQNNNNNNAHRVQMVLHDKFLEILQELPDFKAECSSVLGQIQVLLDVLHQSFCAMTGEQEEEGKENDTLDDDDDDVFEECEGLSVYALEDHTQRGASSSSNAAATTADDAKTNFMDTFQDLLGQVHKKFIPKLHLWHDVLMRYDPSWADTRRSHQLMLEETIRMKERIQSVEGKSRTYWNKLTDVAFPAFSEKPKTPHLSLANQVLSERDHNFEEEEEEEVEFEDADSPFGSSKVSPDPDPAHAPEPEGERKVEPKEKGVSTVVPSSLEVRVTPVVDPTLKPRTAGRRGGKRARNGMEMGVKRKPAPKLSSDKKWKLLRQAPFVEEPDKLHIPDGCEVLANSRGLEIEGHWGATDDSAVVPMAKLAMLHQKTSFYVAQSPAEEISICGAKLSDGSLCQRRDKKICPFHGPIVPRDSNGEPIDKRLSEARQRGRIANHFGSLKSQRDFDRDANLEILQELAGGKKYEMPRPCSSRSSKDMKGKGKGEGKGKGKKAQKDAPVSHRERIHEKLFNPKKNKLMKKLLLSIADIDSRNRNVNKW